MDSFRKAYGALKDSTKVGLAKVNSDFKDLDIAIVKATNHVECPPKERHVTRIFAAVSVPSPRADVGYCIHALSKRLSNTHSWIVAIKSLIVFHRILREGDASFRQELMHISTRGHVFHSSDFKDDSTTLAWDCSGFVRSYALYLEERLECFRSLNCEMKPEERRLTNKSGPRETKEGGMKLRTSYQEQSKNRVLNDDQLLEQLPVLQQLLYRLVCCQPEGAARNNYLVQYALALVVKESFKVYCRINDLMIVLVDTYFDMPKEKAVAALAIYKKAGRQADHLADFYDLCRTLDLAQSFHFPILRQPPSTFVATMEDYIEKAPERVSLSCQMKIEHEKRGEETAEIGEEKAVSEAMQAQQPVDLLGLNEASPKPVQSEETNALALAICEPVIHGAANDQPQTEASPGSGWELALVTAPSSTGSHHQAGGFDRLLLDSLYDDAAARRQLELHRAGYSTHGCGYGYETRPQNLLVQNGEPFAYVAPASDRHMTMMSLKEQQQQQQWQQQQMMMMAPINQPTPYASQNPFGDPFGYPQSSMPMPKPKPPHGNPTLF